MAGEFALHPDCETRRERWFIAHDGIIDPLLVRKTIVKELGRYFADD